jgi:hypothetical protein
LAQIDASIPLGIRLPQIRDPMDVYGNALAIQSAQQRNALVSQQMRDADDARAASAADEAAMREYLQRGGGQQNLNALASRPRAFTAEQKRLIDAEKDKAETDSKRATARKTESDTRIKQAERAAQMLRSATDQQSWSLVRDAIGREAGPDVLANIPQQFTPQIRDAMLQATLTEAERLREETSRRGQDMQDKRTRDEGAANRAVTIRGQNMTDARAREVNAAGGTPPPGYRFTPDGNLEAIPGGPADIKAGELGAKAERKRAANAAAAQNVLSAIADARELIGVTSAGPAGQVLSRVGGTDARDLQSVLETVKGNLGFDRLQEMRDNSPTGGALGAIAVQELTALQSTVASLDQAQSPTQLRRSLEKIERHYKRWLDVVNQAESRAPKAAPKAPASSGGWTVLGVE